MANVNFYVGGQTYNSKNFWKLLDNGTSISEVSSLLFASDVKAICVSANEDIYIGEGNNVHKYNSSLVLDTTWATNGTLDIGATVNSLAVDSSNCLAVAHDEITTYHISFYDSSGSEKWRINHSSAVKGKYVGFTTTEYILAGIETNVTSQPHAARLLRSDGSIVNNYASFYNDMSCDGIVNSSDGNYIYSVAYNADTSGHYIEKYPLNGTTTPNYLWQKGLYGTQNTQCCYLHSDDILYIGTNYAALAGTLDKIDTDDGTTLVSYNTAGTVHGVKEDENNNLVVVGQSAENEDSQTVNISIFDTDLTYLRGYSLGTIFLYALATTKVEFPSAGAPSSEGEKVYSRKEIAIGNNRVYYQTDDTTMSEFEAASGDIDCTEPLEAVEAYQKLFIVNKTNLKVLDFSNTKINTADAGANPCTVGMTLTGGTSAAAMVVDYVDGITDDAAANVYGFRTTTATFSSGETVTGTNSNGDAVSFVTSAAETAPPHWYDWTVFGNDTTNYGTQPTSSTLVALYRGRLVRNDNNNPHAWVMTKVGFPYKVKYDTTNDGDMSAVAYSNNLVGHIGDIITSFISYKDDLLIFGCANSIWILIGDPLADGQLAQVTKETGIWGNRAWCIDGESNLYFLGNDGVYKLPIAETVTNVTNISKLRIPNLIKDWDLDASLHRVTLSYDPVNKGLLIERTLLSDGTNTGYWYDLTTEGFFKESYPASCGIFSSHFYQATDETYKKFHIGCTDGYIREFDNSTLNDATTSSTQAIDSYATMIKQLGEDEDAEGILREISGILAGGASSGDFSDSDSLSWYLYNADDAETALEDVIDGATEFTSGTWTGPGKSDKSYPRMGGYWCALKIRNNTASETWAVDRIYSSIIPKGRK